MTGALVGRLAAETGAKRLIFSWALRETAPWRAAAIPRDRLAAQMARFENNLLPAFIFRIAAGHVDVTDKSNHSDPAAVARLQKRAELYRTLFQDAIGPWCPDLETTLCAFVGDRLGNPRPFPMFAFQKEESADLPLLPDIDFLFNNFYHGGYFDDSLDYAEKPICASFIGSMTGAIVTQKTIDLLALPRFAAANYFLEHPDVDFKLVPKGDFDSPASAAAAANLPFSTPQTRNWTEQRQNRFLISIDGNGATCSRVAIALRSNSVLLKYASNHVLYYFDGLRPWVHTIPIERHADIETVIRQERATPGLFAGIAEQSKQFAHTYLTRDNVLFYVAALLALYEDCLES